MNPDMVPLWQAVPKKTVSLVPPTPAPKPEGEALLQTVFENTKPPPLPQPPKPVPTNVRRRLTLKDKGALEFMKRWFEEVKRDWTELSREMGFLPDSELERTAFVMMMGFATQDSRHITMVTGWDNKWVQERRERARKYDIWKGNGTLTARWFDAADKKDGTAEILWMLDVMIMNGDMERVKVLNNKTWKYEEAYKMSPKGAEWAKRLPPLPPPGPPRPLRREVDRMMDDGCPNGD